jgi:hypothetical protein
MPPLNGPNDRAVMTERELLMKHGAEEKEANARLANAIQQEGLDCFMLGSGECLLDVFVERSRLFEVLGLQTPDPRAQRHIRQFDERIKVARGQASLRRGDGSAAIEFLRLYEVAKALGEFSQHPAMLAWKAAEDQRNREWVAWHNQQCEAERARRRRQESPIKKPLPFSVDALAETLGFYDFGEGGRRQPNDQGPVERWFMNEDGLSLYVRNGEILLEAWRYDLSDEEEDIPFEDPCWSEVNVRQIMFPIPQTAEDALTLLIQADYWPDDPAEREDFFWDYRQALKPRLASKASR